MAQDSQDHGDAREAGFEVGPNPTEPSVEDQRHHEEEPETDNEREAQEARANELANAVSRWRVSLPYDVQIVLELDDCACRKEQEGRHTDDNPDHPRAEIVRAVMLSLNDAREMVEKCYGPRKKPTLN